MALSGTSTLADAKTQYMANLGWKTEASTSKCALFIEACQALLLLMPAEVGRGRGGSQVKMEMNLIADRLKSAEVWLAQNGGTGSGSTGGAVRFASFENFRG